MQSGGCLRLLANLVSVTACGIVFAVFTANDHELTCCA